MDRDISALSQIGELKGSKLYDFIKNRGWQCSHCGNNEFRVEEFAKTKKCSVSAMPYVALGRDGNFYPTDTGSPSYTILCIKCFAETKYNAVRVIDNI